MKKCPTCGASIQEYKHRLSANLILALDRVARHQSGVIISKILTHNQICNFHKLRYWDLIEQCESDGAWEVTRRGFDFLAGLELMPCIVWTFRGERVRYEGELVSSTEYIDARYWRRMDYASNSRAASSIGTDQTGNLFGEAGRG